MKINNAAMGTATPIAILGPNPKPWDLDSGVWAAEEDGGDVDVVCEFDGVGVDVGGEVSEFAKVVVLGRLVAVLLATV
jgi:hypothetical protein